MTFLAIQTTLQRKDLYRTVAREFWLKEENCLQQRILAKIFQELGFVKLFLGGDFVIHILFDNSLAVNKELEK